MSIPRIKKINWKNLFSVILLTVFAIPAILGDGMHLLLPHDDCHCSHLSDFYETDSFASEHSASDHHCCFEKQHLRHDTCSADFCPVCLFCSFSKSNLFDSGNIFLFIPATSVFTDNTFICFQQNAFAHRGRSPPFLSVCLS